MRLRRLVFVLVLVACADSSGGSTTTSASTGEASTGEASTGEANLVGVASTIAPSVLRVAPGSSADSLLYRKLIDDLAADDSEGGPMPANALATMWTRLPDDQIELVRCWIDEGAPQD